MNPRALLLAPPAGSGPSARGGLGRRLFAWMLERGHAVAERTYGERRAVRFSNLVDVDKVMVALGRGAACAVDLSDHWDYWRHLPRPLDEVRAELAIPPLAA